MKTTIQLPDAGKEVTLERADMMFWLRRGRVPKWYAALYIERGQGRIQSEDMAQRISNSSVDEMSELLAFDDELVKYAMRNSGMSVEDLGPEDYDVVLQYAKHNVLPQGNTEANGEQESESAAVHSFRGQ